MEALVYLGKVSLYWVLLYACYWLLLRHHTFFRWNRAYLLGALLLAFVLPLVVYPASAPPLPVVYEVTAAPLVISAQVPTAPFPWLKLLALLYLSGALVMAYRLYHYLLELFSFIRQGETIELDECTLVLMDSDRVGSFSFLKWVVVSRTDYEQHFDAILRHELVHVQQRHSFDILLVEVLRVLFWFNPILIFYKNSLQQVHEYLADEEAPERDRYAEFLVSYALGTPVAALTNHFFNASLLKERIKMLYRQRNSRWSLGKYGAVALLIGLVAVLVAGCEREVPTTDLPEVVASDSQEDILVEGLVVDNENVALPGVSIIIKGTTKGTTTNGEGKFKLSAPKGSELDVEFVGYQGTSVKVVGQKRMSARFMLPEEEEGTPRTFKPPVVVSQSEAPLTLPEPALDTPERIFTVVEKQPEFPGGARAMYDFIRRELKYPVPAQRAFVEGKVFLTFIVTTEGDIKDIQILKGLGFGMDEESIRLIKAMPRWVPGAQSGRPVNVKFNLPITFELAEHTKTSEE
ncbi:hypothetical protein GCM10027275_29900 [Rhabdobacter roseus]|uniref:TonB family protein n=1 Tax=Rhabdobacter roseus TaxID=1655419 RepID=A0A840TPW8_9BACT|nr:M56 family metallopeptidase [Rhabdobacter roseus]MBB5284945.1 TonB family protein [Rhabdobacter roseus]